MTAAVETATIPAQRPAPDHAAARVWALVERAQAGDRAAWAELYEAYQDTVIRFIHLRVGSRQIAQDLSGDVWVRAMKSIRTLTWQGRDPGAWLVTIARNLVADHFKKASTRLEFSTGDSNFDADVVVEPDSHELVSQYFTSVALMSAVAQLNPLQRECIVLRFLRGLSVAETARVMNQNEGAIKALQYRAIRSLHRLLPEGFER